MPPAAIPQPPIYRINSLQKELFPHAHPTPKTQNYLRLAIIAIILILLALGMLFLIFAPGPRMKWALTMGEKYLTDCEYTQAVTMFSRAIRVDDRSEPAYWGRAQAYVQLGDSAAATSDLTYIIDELGTENADVYLTRADLYMDMGDTDAARADLDRRRQPWARTRPHRPPGWKP